MRLVARATMQHAAVARLARCDRGWSARWQNKPKNPSVSITTKSPTHIDASTVGDTQTPSNLVEFDCITLLGLVNVRVRLHVSTWVHYSEKMTGGQGVLIDCASVITLDALSVITLCT